MLVLVTTQKSRRAALTKHLNEHGVFVYVTSFENARMTVQKKDTGGVLLDCIGKLQAGEHLCAELRSDYPQIPIAAIVTPTAVPCMEINRLIREMHTDVLFEDVLDFCIRNCGYSAERLSTYCLSIGNAPDETLYMGYRLHPSPKEHLILRFLFYRAPHYTSPEDLLELCYPEGTQGIENLAVQIGRINRRAKEINQQPLIVHHRGLGYRLRDGILKNDIQKLTL